MFYYFNIFLISGVLAYIAEMFLQHKNKMFFIAFSLLSVFNCAYFAGVRDLTVGYDVMFYETSIFQDACATLSFLKLLKWDPTIEPFFLFLNYISALISDDIHFCLGVISFVTVGFAYMACLRLSQRYKFPLWILFVAYILYYYATSMNLLRQSVCVSICFYLYSCLKDKGWNLYSLMIALLAMLSHNTSVLPIVAYICFTFVPHLSRKKFKRFYCILFFSLIMVLYLYSKILSTLTVLTGKAYDIYADMDSAGDAGWARLHIPYSIILFIVLFALLIWIFRKNAFVKSYNREYICTITFISLTIFMGGFMMGNLSRLNMYFVCLISFYLCQILYGIKRYPKILINVFMIALFTFLYVRTFYDGIEYTSVILNIK